MFWVDISKSLLIQSTVRHWSRLPMELVTAPDLMEFRKHLDSVLRHML